MTSPFTEKGQPAVTDHPPELAGHRGFVLAAGWWERLAFALLTSGDPRPLRAPYVFRPDSIERLAAHDPTAAMAAVRHSARWIAAPHNLGDLAACLRDWRTPPADGHFVKARHAVAGHGDHVVEVASCGDCALAVMRRGDPDAPWDPIWPPPNDPDPGTWSARQSTRNQTNATSGGAAPSSSGPIR